MSDLDDILRREGRDVLRRELPGLEEAVPLAPLCAYGVGGPAELLYRAATTGALAHAVRTAREVGVPVTVLGRATNVLISDAGLPGLTVLARNEAHTLDGELLMVEAGAELPGLVAELAGQGLAGLEFAGNIPGSVGGAVVGNAGAYGRSMSDVTLSAGPLTFQVSVIAPVPLCKPRSALCGWRPSAVPCPPTCRPPCRCPPARRVVF